MATAEIDSKRNSDKRVCQGRQLVNNKESAAVPSKKVSSGILTSPKEIFNGILNRAKSGRGRQAEVEVKQTARNTEIAKSQPLDHDRRASTNSSVADTETASVTVDGHHDHISNDSSVESTLSPNSQSQNESKNTRKSSNSSIETDTGSVDWDGWAETPCIECGVVGSQQMLKCSSCKLETCAPCTKLSEAQISNIRSLKWKCPLCVTEFKKQKGVLSVSVASEPNAQMDRIEAMFLEMSKTLSSKADSSVVSNLESRLEKRIDQLEKALETAISSAKQPSTPENIPQAPLENNHPVSNNFREIMQEQLEEWKDEERRKLNVILYNLPENTQNTETDETQTLELLSHILGEPAEAKIERIFRLGKADQQKTRPISVRFRNIEAKRSVMKQTYKVKDSGFNQVSVASDLTSKQRIAQKIVYEEMKRRRMAGESDLVMRRGEIVRRKAAPDHSQTGNPPMSPTNVRT